MRKVYFNYILHLLAGVSLGWFLFACSPIKRHQKLVEKYPFVHTQDTIIMRDTLRVQVPKVEHDTIVKYDQLVDTIILEKDNLRVQVHTIHDSVYIQGHCDSILVEKIVERKVPIRYYEVESSWLKWIILCLIILFTLYSILRNRNNEKNI